jgi:uncharacterized membrane protein
VTQPVRSPAILVRPAPAGSGFRWWSESLSWLFGGGARFGVWFGMALCVFLVLVLLPWIPLVGSLAAHLLWFVLCGGLMAAARDTERGQTPRFGALFAGFGAQGGALVGAGLLVLVGTLVVWGLLLAVGIGATLKSLASMGSLEELAATPPPALLNIGWGTLLALLFCLFLLVLISMAAWLAPALIVLRGARPVDALRLSLAACRRNLGALTVYGLVGVGLAVIATAIILVGWILLLALVFLSTYAAYRDMFEPDLEVPEAGP